MAFNPAYENARAAKGREMAEFFNKQGGFILDPLPLPSPTMTFISVMTVPAYQQCPMTTVLPISHVHDIHGKKDKQCQMKEEFLNNPVFAEVVHHINQGRASFSPCELLTDKWWDVYLQKVNAQKDVVAKYTEKEMMSQRNQEHLHDMEAQRKQGIKPLHF